VPVPDDLISLRDALRIVTRERDLDPARWIDALSVGDIPTYRVNGRRQVRLSDAKTWFPT
jgi:hypothetical protein